MGTGSNGTRKISRLVILAIVLLLAGLMVIGYGVIDAQGAEITVPDTPVPPGKEYPDTDGWDWRIEWRSDSETAFHLLYIGDYPNLTSGWDGCHVVIEATCQDSNMDAPEIGTLCKRIGSRELTCQGDVQPIKWTDTLKKWCIHYVPLAVASPPYEPPEPVCSCDLYYIDGYRNIIDESNKEFYLSLPAFPQMGYAPDLQVYQGDTIYHVGAWGGDGGWGADACFVSADLTVKAKGYPQTTIDCTSGICSYDCNTMHLTQTASVIQSNVYLEDRQGNQLICRGRYNGFDPCDPETHTCIDAPYPYEWEE